MYKSLLLGTIALTASAMAGSAVAQTQDTRALEPINQVMTGQVVSRPGQTPLANNNNNAFGTARPGPAANPTPGTVVVRLLARTVVQYYEGWNSLMNATPGYSTTSNQMSSWMRLYPGIDAMAANGMRYGAATEIRMNSPAAATPSGNTPGSGASANSNAQTLYVRRAFIYFGADKLGIVRVGQGDGLISLFDGGRTTLQTFSPTSNFNGSDLGAAIGGGTAPPWVFLSGAGNEYDTQKIVYLSPSFSGFDFGLQYSPSAFNSLAGCTPTTVAASTGCSNLSSSLNPLDGQRYMNLISGGVRYNGNVGPVNLLAYGVYTYSGHVNTNLGPAASRVAVGAGAGSTWNGQFDNLNFGSMGVAATYSGFTLGANFITGAMNGQLATRPSGGANMNAWLVGAQYQTGPLTIGTVFASINSQGAVAMTGLSQRQEYEFNVGGSYALAPGLVVFADYIYQNRKQSGWNFATNTVGAANNQIQGQGFVLGSQVTW